ncbi:hypothetical protein TIFTF001_013058 [Ficus carica]|uniref:Uncharacterized protein n=1 Tax=Ficus carica TaxID=3494 RepID=A0AA88D489_FICCA|nr:hypothetical protein TIFTF001_013058 [Ficus carica]
MGDNLLRYPELDQAVIGHSRQVVLAERKLTSYVYAVGKPPTGDF